MNSDNNRSDGAKVKVLLFGPIIPSWIEQQQQQQHNVSNDNNRSIIEQNCLSFVSKLKSLYYSKAGPFHIIFVLGCIHDKNQQLLMQTIRQHGHSVPPSCPIYIQDNGGSSNNIMKSNNNNDDSNGVDSNHDSLVKSATTTAGSSNTQNDNDSENNDQQYLQSPCYEIVSNIYLLRNKDGSISRDGGGIFDIPIPSLSTSSLSRTSLIVISCPSRFRIYDTNSSALMSSITHVSYTGCDLFLSYELPQGIESILPSSTSSDDVAISYDIADVAIKARSRYHITANPIFQQTPPFVHVSSTTHTTSTSQIPATGRLITLCPINNDKTKKYVHALGIVPYHQMSVTERIAATKQPNIISSCPFTDVSYEKDKKLTSVNTDSVTIDHHNNTNNNRNSNFGLSDASARRIVEEERQKLSGGHIGDRWGSNNSNSNNNKRQRIEQQQDMVVDPSNKVLFIHGLHKDVSGRLQQPNQSSDQKILQALGPHAVRVIRPNNATTSSYCFVEFISHQTAYECLQRFGSNVTIDGTELQIKWRSSPTSSQHTIQNNNRSHHHDMNDRGNTHNKKLRLTEDDAIDSNTLYFKFVMNTEMITSSSLFDISLASDMLRQLLERTLEDALSGGESSTNSNNNSDRVTADKEPALQVKLRLPSSSSLSLRTSSNDHDNQGIDNNESDEKHHPNYGFFDFASHAAASLAMATLTGSTDGGKIVTESYTTQLSDIYKKAIKTATSSEDNPSTITDETSMDWTKYGTIYLHWSKKYVEKQQQSNLIESNHNGNHNKMNDDRNYVEDVVTGFRFQRKHFPPDARTDCWFCLASPSCEKHLITGIYDTCYTAMPKGPIHPGHILIIPVQHTNGGVWYDRTMSHEVNILKQLLRQHARENYDNAELFIFERAIRTKGAYHTHMQCIPVTQGLGHKIQTNMLAQANKIRMDLREVNSDLQIETVLQFVNHDDDDDDSDHDDHVKKHEPNDYFYAEVPTAAMTYKRFLYQASNRNSNHDHQQTSGDRGNNNTTTAIVPIQFGREIVAAALGQPDLAHWKSCVVNQNLEASMASTLRQSFQKVWNNYQNNSSNNKT